MKEQIKQHYPLINTFLLLLLSLLFIIFSFLPIASIYINTDALPLTKYYPEDAIATSRLDLGVFPLLSLLLNMDDALQAIDILELRKELAETDTSTQYIQNRLDEIEDEMKAKDPEATIDSFLKDCFSKKGTARAISFILTFSAADNQEYLSVSTSNYYSAHILRIILVFSTLFCMIGAIFAVNFLIEYGKYVWGCIEKRKMPTADSATAQITFGRLDTMSFFGFLVGIGALMFCSAATLRPGWYLALGAYLALCIFLGEWKMKDTQSAKQRILLYTMRGSGLVSFIFGGIFLFSVIGQRLFHSALAVSDKFVAAYTEKLLTQQANPDYAGVIQSTKEYAQDVAQKQIMLILVLSALAFVLAACFVHTLLSRISLSNQHLLPNKRMTTSLTASVLLIAIAIIPLFFGVSTVQERQIAWEEGKMEFVYDEYKNKNSDAYLECQLAELLYQIELEQQKLLNKAVKEAESKETREFALRASIAHQEVLRYVKHHLNAVKTHQKASIVLGILSAVLMILPEAVFTFTSQMYLNEQKSAPKGYGEEDDEDDRDDTNGDHYAANDEECENPEQSEAQQAPQGQYAPPITSLFD